MKTLLLIDMDDETLAVMDEDHNVLTGEKKAEWIKKMRVMLDDLDDEFGPVDLTNKEPDSLRG